MKRMNRLTAWGLACVFGAGLFAVPVAARASEEGERNTALGLTAAAAALLLTQKNKLPGIIAGAGAAYAWKKNQDSIKARREREREWGYNPRNNNRDDRYREDDRFDRNDRYRDDYRDRDDIRYGNNRNDNNRNDNRYGNSRRDPVSGRYPTSNRRDNRYDDDCDDNGRSPYGRAVGHYKNGKR